MDSAVQLAFLGMDETGAITNSGNRIVYFFDAGAFVKIGFTTRPDLNKRRGEEQTGCPEKLEIIGSIAVGANEDDRDLHHKFREYHYRGEWFRKTPELLKAIQWEIDTRDRAHALILDYGEFPYGGSFPCWYCGQDLFFAMSDPAWQDIPASKWPEVTVLLVDRNCRSKTPILVRPRSLSEAK